jgi:hypothetical protein
MKKVGRSGQLTGRVRVFGRRRGALLQAKIVTAGVDTLVLHFRKREELGETPLSGSGSLE